MGRVAHLVAQEKRISPEEERRQIQREKQKAILQSLDCLYGVPSDELDELVALCYFRIFRRGETIISEYKASEFFYLLLQGSVCLTLHDRDGQEILLEVLNRGDCCGEEALFNIFSFNAGAYAESPCYTLQLPLLEVRSLLSRKPGLYHALHRIYLRRLVEIKLARVPLFNQISLLDRLTLAAQLQPRQYPRDTVVTQQGDPGDALYVIESGQIVVEQDGQSIAVLDSGDFLGEVALICNQPHSATARTITPANILALSAESFQGLLSQHPELGEQIKRVCEQRVAVNRTTEVAQEHARRLSLAVKYGLVRGTHLLVRSISQCPSDCFACETACASRFGETRLYINGVVFGDSDVVHTCRQCRVGAECVEVCPEDAIEWNDHHALVITEACNGCGDCVPACPYDAVTLLTNRTTPIGGALKKWLNKLSGFRKKGSLDEWSLQTFPRANKCDLCHGYDDLACATACPEKAIQLVRVEDVLTLKGTDWYDESTLPATRRL